MTNRTTALETALLNKLDHLPVTPRRTLRLRQFNLDRYPVLCWLHGVTRRGRRYALQCDVREDGALEVTCRPVLNAGKAFRMPKAARFPGQLGD